MNALLSPIPLLPGFFYLKKVMLKGRNALLSFFSITKNCRGLGYGHGAVRAVFNYALENGCRHIALNVSSDNKPALKTYKKAGFKEALRISMFCDFINVD